MSTIDEQEAEGPVAGLSALKEVTPPASLVPAVMRRIAEPRAVSAWSWLRPSRRIDEQEAEGPVPGLAALREVTPPASMVPAVMRRIAEPQPTSFWSWLRQSRRIEMRISPLGMLAAMGTAACLAVVLTARQPSLPTASLPPLPDPGRSMVVKVEPGQETVVVRFVLVAKGAHKVAVSGDFNGWNPTGTVLENADGRGTFVAFVPLPRGAHEYMFLVDGEWVTDPAAPETRPDGFGRSNAVLRL
jgi:hypothetical protein